tara:strand:+ start:208 stop:357 length:150 start_codon:yes stop_codon:yes gene_type:complete
MSALRNSFGNKLRINKDMFGPFATAFLFASFHPILTDAIEKIKIGLSTS